MELPRDMDEIVEVDLTSDEESREMQQAIAESMRCMNEIVEVDLTISEESRAMEQAIAESMRDMDEIVEVEPAISEDSREMDQAVAESMRDIDFQIASQVAVINNIFPDAAPDFLEEKINSCIDIGNDVNKFEQYVEEVLKIRKYPTMKEYIKKTRATTSKFNEELVDNGNLGNEQAVDGDVLVECPICFEEKPITKEINGCSAMQEHLYCNQCIQKYIEAVIGDGQSVFKCMDTGCQGEFSLRVLQKILQPSVLSKIMERRQHEEILKAGIQDLESCPFCHFKVIISNPSDKVFHCLNPECLVSSCRLCKEVSHIPLRCEEVERDPQKEARKRLENKMSEAMIRECPQCKKRFIKAQGCNHITCSCGASICYYCKHLMSSPHHINSERCRQTSDENVIHAQDVRNAAQEGKQELDPSITLVHDPTLGIL